MTNSALDVAVGIAESLDVELVDDCVMVPRGVLRLLVHVPGGGSLRSEVLLLWRLHSLGALMLSSKSAGFFALGRRATSRPVMRVTYSLAVTADSGCRERGRPDPDACLRKLR